MSCCTLLFLSVCTTSYPKSPLIDHFFFFLWCKIMCTLTLPKYDSQWENSGYLSQICLSLPHSVFYVIRRFCWKIKYMCMCVYIYVYFQDIFFSLFLTFLLCIHSPNARILRYPFPESGIIYLSLSVSLTDFSSVKKKSIILSWQTEIKTPLSLYDSLGTV